MKQKQLTPAQLEASREIEDDAKHPKFVHFRASLRMKRAESNLKKKLKMNATEMYHHAIEQLCDITRGVKW